MALILDIFLPQANPYISPSECFIKICFESEEIEVIVDFFLSVLTRFVKYENNFQIFS
jgi:hypothetical protein